MTLLHHCSQNPELAFAYRRKTFFLAISICLFYCAAGITLWLA